MLGIIVQLTKATRSAAPRACLRCRSAMSSSAASWTDADFRGSIELFGRSASRATWLLELVLGQAADVPGLLGPAGQPGQHAGNKSHCNSRLRTGWRRGDGAMQHSVGF